jgi:hypothetical protein
MRPPFAQGETLVEFFKGLVDEALERQHQSAHELTRFYLVHLLATRTRTDGVPPAAAQEALALRFARALESSGARRRADLRGLADDALFVAGFFSDSLARALVDVEYYAALGGYAYQQLSAAEDTLAPAFAELGSRFLGFADVLTEISEQSAMTSDTNLLRLYERWLAHDSGRNTERLLRRGVLPSLGARQARSRLH